ncbi:sterol desaturase family protein [Aspergillus thermomutatus]|uniref:Fatty acid hydroxylase domain-containing protein n=1 Tax=Aspergillus thermomutatus TaxID=41047 RepID=A0A397FX16_ASPTH|nr:uncharacterized protein CDV56_100870 [Aspergillus thermomutatus]RHZ43215.1 hypothetical protein CDV56_100870 [Aspergillus thermomutatus]
MLGPVDRLVHHFANTWQDLVERYPAGVIEIGISLFVSVFALIVPSTIFLSIDTAFPDFVKRHKKQAEEKRPHSVKLAKCILLVILNISLAISTVVLSKLCFGWQFSPFRVDPELPSGRMLLLDFAYAALCREVIVYYIHRLSHWPWFYKHIHRVHHEFQAPIGFVAGYIHPIESQINGGAPLYVPLAVRRAHMVSYLVFFFATVFYVVLDHTGYTVWWFPNARAHDLHHEKLTCNFGMEKVKLCEV